MSSLIVEICKVNKVEHCPNSDNLDIITVKGWNCLVTRDLYKVGDKVIYAPIDALIPQELSDSMGVTKYLGKNGRVRTQKMRGVYSQGLIIDTSYLEQSVPKKHIDIGLGDIAHKLGITKYEPPIHGYNPDGTSKKKRGSREGDTAPNHPAFHIYTNIKNIKN